MQSIRMNTAFRFKAPRGKIYPLLLAAILFFAPCPDSAAHEAIGSVSHGILIVEGDTANYYLHVTPVISSLLDAEARGDAEWLKDYFSDTLRLTTWDTACTLTDLQQETIPTSRNRIVHLSYTCPRKIEDLTVTSALFLDLDEKHVQIIRLARPDNPKYFLQEGMLSVKNFKFHIADVETGGSAILSRILSFFRLGVEHLLTGYDHILFLLSIIIVSVRFLEVVKIITAFTVAHSLTMALAFFGILSIPSQWVESAIALTIVYVAMENLFGRILLRRWVLTFLFGLIHGLGFVGVLKDITISREELIVSLISFNIGIEAGQLIVLSVSLPLLMYIKKQPWGTKFYRLASLLFGLLGLIWFGERALNLRW